MLHGIGQRKVRLRQLFGATARCPFEDVVTSTVFGPLEFLPVHDSWTAVRTIARRMGVPETLLAAKVDRVVPKFWNRRPSAYRRRSIEPDLVVEACSDGDLVFRLIVEVKWGAGLEVDQLVAAWDAFPLHERSRTHQLLLVLDQERYAGAVEKELRRWEASDTGRDGWRNRLSVRSWRDLSHAFQELLTSSESPGLHRWAELAVRVLRNEDVSTQVGWRHAGLLAVPVSAWKFTLPEVPAVLESVP